MSLAMLQRISSDNQSASVHCRLAGHAEGSGALARRWEHHSTIQIFLRHTCCAELPYILT